MGRLNGTGSDFIVSISMALVLNVYIRKQESHSPPLEFYPELQ